jgi:hypothetical protein
MELLFQVCFCCDKVTALAYQMSEFMYTDMLMILNEMKYIA